jgi:hypothetical protein
MRDFSIRNLAIPQFRISDLPLHGAFLCSIDLRGLLDLAEEETFDVVEEECLRVGIG